MPFLPVCDGADQVRRRRAAAVGGLAHILARVSSRRFQGGNGEDRRRRPLIDWLRCFNPRRRRPRMGSQRPSAERDNLSFSSARESKPQRHFIPRRRSAPPISPPSLLGSLPSYHPDLERPLPRPASPASPASLLEQPLARPPFGHFRDVCPSSVPQC